MIIIRPIREKDTEDFIDIAFAAGIGMTSMPKNRESLKKKVLESGKAFSEIPPQDAVTYLFVLEDLETGKIEGTCGIIAKTGMQTPISFYRLEKNNVHKGIGTAVKSVPIFDIVHHHNYWSEICSLYLSPNYRHSGIGRLLSFSRFLFIAEFPKRFSTKIFAEMRGFVHEDNVSPFWQGIGSHFIDASFETIMALRDEGKFDLSLALPLHPIYMELLPHEVQEAIGKVHNETRAALQMLQQEGFTLSDEFDICDGGPKIEAVTKKIRSVRTSIKDKIVDFATDMPDAPKYILSNNSLDFKACYSSLQHNKKGGVIIPHKVAKALKLNIGDTIRYVSPFKE
jgi:arginine N-succinyltransferase